MSLETSSTIFTIIILIGFAVAVYFLIKDRIEIIRSIKPNSLEDFFGMNNSEFGLRHMSMRILINILALFLWVPFWILDKLFKLNIFKENNPK